MPRKVVYNGQLPEGREIHISAENGGYVKITILGNDGKCSAVLTTQEAACFAIDVAEYAENSK